MDNDKFQAILPILVTHLVDKIISADSISQENAIKNLYNSKLYDILQKEESKVWQYSTDKLYELYKEEINTGTYHLPEY